MRAFRSLALVAVLAGVALAGAPPSASEMAPADVTRWLGFWDRLVDTVARPQTTCEQLAVNVSDLVDKNKDAITIAKTARQQGKKLPESAQQHMLDGVRKMVPAMQKCGQHDRVRAAFAKLDLNRR